MRRIALALILALILAILPACSDDDAPAQRSELDAAPDAAVVDQQPDLEQPDAAIDQAEQLDAAPDLVEDLAPDAPPDMGVCACAAANECCDGCDIINPHTCPAPQGECKVAACDPAAGCSTVNAPDDTRCGGNAGLCKSGACVPNPACECRDDDGPCCRDCRFLPAGTVCQENWTVARCDLSVPNQVFIDESVGEILCVERMAECAIQPRSTNFRSPSGSSRSCGNTNVATCTPGEGVDYQGCGVRP